jgi:hypothetical protein
LLIGFNVVEFIGQILSAAFGGDKIADFVYEMQILSAAFGGDKIADFVYEMQIL